ncbi:DUF4129 domain-containing protein [Mycobacterium sp.]|uniref:DUF4129 domain-containing protein n=1 Tax=Mycobacterium sp. TaxID=1785 RepID=UPI001218D9B1|nr:DUF4129 domain-containing protein [Mycobacterium sp.]TAM68099.1 MAG: DUF4129 domain-containing protein [Mycobacterium sp.]
MDKPTGRVVALIVLLLVVAAALRGYLPAPHHAVRGESGGRAALVLVVAILAAMLALVAIAVVARLRDPRAPAPSAGALSDMLGTGRGRPSWRVLLIGLAVIVAWLLIVMLLARLLVPHPLAPAPSPSETGALPSSHATTPPQQGQHRPRDGSQNMLGVLLAGTVVMLLMVVAGAVATARRRRPTAPGIADEPVESRAPGAPSRSLARAAELGLAEMTDPRREPRGAIIACYAAMERELAHVPGAVPQDFDTPSEVLARAVERHALQAGNAVQLVDLFTEARFSPHVMNESHRDVAVRVLRLVLDELGSRSVV